MRLIFLHLPRTGGMSVRNVMEQVFGHDNVGRPWWGDHAGEELTEEDKEKKAWFGHFRYGLHKWLGKDVRYFTMLRHPVDRFVSEYCRNQYRTKFGFTPVQLAQNLNKCFGFDGYGDNLQVRLLAGETRETRINSSHVERALENLDRFVHVGFYDQYERTIEFFRSLGWKFEPVHINAGKHPKDVTEDEMIALRSCPQLQHDIALWERLRGLA